MTTGSLYNLTWGEYGTSLISAVQLLRCHDELVDVTLAAGGRTFHAHKVVLCAASPFLLDLLKSTTCKHPVVMLAGVQASDLEALLEFVYRGEVSVDPNQLPSLLQAAHCLNIQGLSPSTIALNGSNLQPNVKHEILKNCEVPQTAAFVTDTTDVGFKRKRRAKRSSTSPTLNKWSKVYVTETNDNVAIQSQDDNSNSWSQQGNSMGNLSGTTTQISQIENQQLQQQILVQNLPVSVGISVQSKTRGASDQPGACPLCGAMLRQARNLRRHLITSCKYRMLSNLQTSTTTTATATTPTQTTNINERTDQQQQQDAQLDVQTMSSNNAAMACNNLLPTTSSLLSMQ